MPSMVSLSTWFLAQPSDMSAMVADICVPLILLWSGRLPAGRRRVCPPYRKPRRSSRPPSFQQPPGRQGPRPAPLQAALSEPRPGRARTLSTAASAVCRSSPFSYRVLRTRCAPYFSVQTGTLPRPPHTARRLPDRAARRRPRRLPHSAGRRRPHELGVQRLFRLVAVGRISSARFLA